MRSWIGGHLFHGRRVVEKDGVEDDPSQAELFRVLTHLKSSSYRTVTPVIDHLTSDIEGGKDGTDVTHLINLETVHWLTVNYRNILEIYPNTSEDSVTGSWDGESGCVGMVDYVV